jgi:hypothetical protein
MVNQSVAQVKPPQFEITLKHNDPSEQRTKQQLLRLLSTYDFSKWIYTTKVQIDRTATPHSHPVLTLNARHLKDDELLIATFVHEQLHWYVNQKLKETEAAYQELKTIFPDAPVGFPRGGNSEEWTYKHILVCFLEYQAVKDVLGELKARQVMDFWSTDHYTWIYSTVRDRERDLAALFRKHKLWPIIRP